jgi:CheY-like chemotaxis protein
LVEDDPALGEMYRLALEASGHSVTLVTCGSAAIDALQADVPEILLLDIGLPDGDGLTLLEAIRSREDRRVREVPAVALTNYADPENRARASRLGTLDYVVKAWTTPRQLVSNVSRWLELQVGIGP